METVIRQTLLPQDILNIFVEEHRLCSPLDCMADPSVELTSTTTVDDWREARDLLPWRPLSDFLNKQFNISATKEEWKSVLEPSDQRILNDVCVLISNCSTYTDIRPIKRFGHNCLTASVFLTIKKYLKARNVDVNDLRPSSEISHYLEKYFSEMIEQINIISKGGQVFDTLDYARKKTGFFNAINIFDKDRFTFATGDIVTFRDLTNKIIKLNKECQSRL